MRTFRPDIGYATLFARLCEINRHPLHADPHPRHQAAHGEHLTHERGQWIEREGFTVDDHDARIQVEFEPTTRAVSPPSSSLSDGSRPSNKCCVICWTSVTFRYVPG